MNAATRCRYCEEPYEAQPWDNLPIGRFAILKCGMDPKTPALTFNDVDLLFRLCNHLRKHLDQTFDDEHNLSFDEIQVLWHVATNEGDCRPSTATGLDEALALSKRAKHHVDKLKELALLEEDVESHWRDNRRKQLRLSQTGNQLLDKLLVNWRVTAANIFDTLDQERLRQLSGVLRDLIDAPDALRRRLDAA